MVLHVITVSIDLLIVLLQVNGGFTQVNGGFTQIVISSENICPVGSIASCTLYASETD